MMNKPTRRDLIPIEWTPETLKNMRLELRMTQEEVGNILGISKAAVGYIERGTTTAPMELLSYGIVLERAWAYKRGYVPAYRKIGTNLYLEEPLND